MTNEEITIGTKVICNGFEGTVTEVCTWDANMVEVRLPGGIVCVGKSTCKIAK